MLQICLKASLQLHQALSTREIFRQFSVLGRELGMCDVQTQKIILWKIDQRVDKDQVKS